MSMRADPPDATSTSHGERNRAFCARHRPARPPTNRNVAWYRRERPKWIAFLGGKCAACGRSEEEANAEGETLEFDHDAPRDWEPRKCSRWQRLRNYIKDIRAGKIKSLLCRSCNARKGFPTGQQELIENAALAKAGRHPF